MNCLPQTYEELTTLTLKLVKENQQLRDTVKTLEKRISQLERKPPPNIPFHLKPSIKSGKKKAKRKKRAKGYGRKKDIPTNWVKHAYSHCPDCGGKLFNGWLKSSRQVIDIPLAPVTITEHQVYEHWCDQCRKKVSPQLDLSSQVIGSHRISIKSMSYIATLREVYRLPYEQIQDQLSVFHQLDLSIGQLVKICHTVSKKQLPVYDSLEEAIRLSPIVHGDETGWREDGINGYIWGFNTPTIKYLTYRKTRSKVVVEEIIGSDFEGVLITDFYGSYNTHQGLHQRCWVHLLRDVKKLIEANPNDKKMKVWAREVKSIYGKAKNYQGPDPNIFDGAKNQRQERWRMQSRFRDQLVNICRPYLNQDVPQRVLCQRIYKFQDELFMFVTDPKIPSDNNSAERSLRHSVISRKISGGTRSSKGSTTKFILASVFGTWKLQNKNPFQECIKLLTAASTNQPLPAICS